MNNFVAVRFLDYTENLPVAPEPVPILRKFSILFLFLGFRGLWFRGLGFMGEIRRSITMPYPMLQPPGSQARSSVSTEATSCICKNPALALKGPQNAVGSVALHRAFQKGPCGKSKVISFPSETVDAKGYRGLTQVSLAWASGLPPRHVYCKLSLCTVLVTSLYHPQVLPGS